MPFLDENEIVKALSTSNNPRATIYVNERRIDEYYCQRIGPITELTKSGKLSGKIGAGLLGFLQSEVASETGLGGSGALTPILKAILLEREARHSGHLADLSFDSAEERSLLTFVGESRLIDDDEAVCGDEKLGLSIKDAQVIQDERTAQEKRLRAGTIVWLSSGHRVLASVCTSSDKFIDRGHWSSYREGPYGILGRHESKIEGVQFISPFWIWHEGW